MNKKEYLPIKIDKNGNLTLKGEPVKEKNGIIMVKKSAKRDAYMAKEFFIYMMYNNTDILPEEEVDFADGNCNNFAPKNLVLKKRPDFSCKEYEEFHGYHVYKSGIITREQKSKTTSKDSNAFLTEAGLYEKPLRVNDIDMVYIKVDGRNTTILASRIIYNAFAPKPLTRNQKLVFLDGNLQNRHFSNLKKVNLADIDYLNGSHKKRFDEATAREIKERYENETISYRTLAKEYRCNILTIEKIMAGRYYTEDDE